MENIVRALTIRRAISLAISKGYLWPKGKCYNIWMSNLFTYNPLTGGRDIVGSIDFVKSVWPDEFMKRFSEINQCKDVAQYLIDNLPKQ